MSQESAPDHPYPDYPRLGAFYQKINEDEDARVCKDIPESACRHQPRNYFAYLGANALSKIADELSSARLILPWLLGAAGASSGFAGFLVPIREAGVLLPQLLVAAWIRRLARRKYVWLVGALLSLLALVGMALSGARLEGNAVGWLVIGLLVIYSLARGLCSVSAKDVLGKTVSKTRRGALMGYSASIAGVATLGIGIYTEYLRGDEAGSVFTLFLLGAAGLWALAMVLFVQIQEAPGATEGGGNAFSEALKSVSLLWRDRDFGHFVLARALLLSSALAPPFFVLLAQQYTDNMTGLGLLIIASGLAASLSAPVWGKMSDRSSRRAMALASAGAGALCLVAWLLAALDARLLTSPWLHALLFLGISVCHGGIRLGRKVYLVDMATRETRASYVAVSNTVIGVLMLVAGSIGLLSIWLGVAGVLGILGVVALVAAIYGARLKDVSG
ncbi:MFS transporter [Marinimicrobium alkaliphilum]|uniref:MFS transporter n=1 Tax=Marinimicrobium alkaliphilum TaxID=2202654 RepID=UPI000DBA6637|nr:MFS transporter [Marinimicrobium alkaliphilum]